MSAEELRSKLGSKLRVWQESRSLQLVGLHGRSVAVVILSWDELLTPGQSETPTSVPKDFLLLDPRSGREQ